MHPDSLLSTLPPLGELSTDHLPTGVERGKRVRIAFLATLLGPANAALVAWSRSLLSTSDTEPERGQLLFVRDVQLRHIGETALLNWPQDDDPWFATLEPELQRVALAHVVQSAADARLEAVDTYVERARQTFVRDPTLGAGALRLRGAIGRALAAVGDFAGADEWLKGACQGWLALSQVGQMSHALCELLRVRGIQRDRDGILALAGWVTELRNASLANPISTAYLQVALGRAYAQTGRYADALHELTTGDWGVTEDVEMAHVRGARWRWLHFAALKAGDAPRASNARAAIERLPPIDQRFLAAIDAALAQPTLELESHVRALLTYYPGADEANRTFARISPHLGPESRLAVEIPEVREAVERVAWEYRY